MSSHDNSKIIEQIAKAAGTKAKMHMLRAYPQLFNLVRTTYSPYIHFGIKPTAAWIDGCGLGEWDAATNKMLNDLSKGRLTGSAAKSTLCAELSRLEPYSQDLLIKMINKDLRWGMQATTINKALPGCVPVFPVQLAKLYEAGRMSFPCVASPKLDGLRCIFLDGKMRSRYGNELRGLDHIAEAIQGAWPNVRRIDGELMVPGMTFNALSGEIRAFRQTDNAVYHVFDWFVDGPVAPFYVRYSQYAACLAMENYSNIQPVAHETVVSEGQAASLYDEYRKQGYEGLVLKNEEALDVTGRTWDWCKIKPSDTADCLVTGTEAGEGKYLYSIGALIVDFNGKECRVGGGLTDAQRNAWYEDPNLIVGKTVEVEYMEITEYGAMRHPRLKVVRGDL